MARMVMIDPDAALRHLLHDALEEEGYHVIEAHNAYEGLPHTQAARPAVPLGAALYLVACSSCVRHRGIMERERRS